VSDIPVVDPVARQIAKVPPLAWVGLALAVGIGAIILHRYNVDPEDTNWLDPGQPPLNADMDFKLKMSNVIGTAAPKSSPMRAPKPYFSPNLTCWDGSWVGDC
jgi:hypothetical protein